jgi:hypothetical protein
MVFWSEFAAAAPWLATDMQNLIHQYGPGLGYLATVRPDGGPRLHPVAPVVTDGGLFCFLLPSPKRRDLERDGRYALHTFPPEHDDTEGYLSGRAHLVTDPTRRHRVAAAARAAIGVDWRLFELDIEVAMVTRHAGSAHVPSHVVWHAPREPSSARPEPSTLRVTIPLSPTKTPTRRRPPVPA